MLVLSGYKLTTMHTSINCDMGEGIGNDAAIMPYIHTANIACGYHAGGPETMWETVGLALRHGVSVSAHVSFLDREHFGRKEMNMDEQELTELVTQQLQLLFDITQAQGGKLEYVKPHGAMYNQAASDPVMARTIARAVRDFDPALALIGLSGSCAIEEAKAVGLKTMSEVFADRTYRENGSLSPRSGDDALIHDVDKLREQVRQMISEGQVTTTSGKKIPVQAETICIHGDGPHAVEFAKAVHEIIQQQSDK